MLVSLIRNSKLNKSAKFNENQDPFIGLADNFQDRNSDFDKRKVEEDEEYVKRISSIAEHYNFENELNEEMEDEEGINNNFLFAQLNCTDEKLQSNENSMKNMSDDMIIDEESQYTGFNNDLKRFSEDLEIQITPPKKNSIKSKSPGNSDPGDAIDAGKLLNYLISIEGVYSPDPSYLETLQPDITSVMRAILLDWMMEVWNEFTLKRETYYYAVNYVDRFLSVCKDVKKEELQLIGVTAMFMAAKMEEVYSPRVADFAKSTDNGYGVKEIIIMEKHMLKELSWRTTPPTYAMWANWYMNQWDIFINTNEYALSHEIVRNNPDLTFKSSNETSYVRFRDVMQIIDLIILDHNCLLYQPRGLVVSIMFLVLGIHVGVFEIQKIWNEFVYSSNGFLDTNSEFNQLFIEFIFLSFGYQLHDLAPTIQYVSSFMSIPFNYDMPMYCQNNNALEGHFEEFLSYQTHHPLALNYIQQRIANSEAF